MKELYKQMTNTNHHSNIYDLSEVIPNLKLEYPGNRKGKKPGDYRLNLNGKIPKHPEFVRSIHSHCTKDPQNAKELHLSIRGLCSNGLDNKSLINQPFHFENYTLDGKQFNSLMYWLILQEDINYERPRKRGVRLPLTRYLEAIISAVQPDLLNIEKVANDADFRDTRPIPAFKHEELSDDFEETFRIIDKMPL